MCTHGDGLAKPTVCVHTEEVAYFSFTMTMAQINVIRPNAQTNLVENLPIYMYMYRDTPENGDNQD